MSFWRTILSLGRVNERKRGRRMPSNAITAGSKTAGGNWHGVGSNASTGEDALNQEYLKSLGEVQQRAQDLDVNNPDVRGFHRARAAQILAAGVRFRCHPHPDEVGVPAERLTLLARQVDRIRQLHSRLGGFDNSGRRRSEGTQQVRAFLTAMVVGSCLIHRVWRWEAGIPLPLRLELIPGSRISTPYDRAADPKISYGIEYADEHRTRVVGYHVRRVSASRGNSMVPDYAWDFIPIEDGVLMELTEIAGLDRAMPLSVANVRMLRNRGEFIESAVASARAQSKTHAAIEVEEGANAWQRALDDSEESAEKDAAGVPMRYVTVGDTEVMFLNAGEKMNWKSAQMPGPDFGEFVDKTDERLARGFGASLSRFTRKVNSSWAGGRLEDQQDDPLVEQYRALIYSAWQRVHEWFLEALWLTGKVELPGYSTATAALWAESSVTWPGKVHINPVDVSKARSIAFGLRTQTPQGACEEDGLDLETNLRKWAQALQLSRKLEAEFGLEEGDLSILMEGTAVTTTAGEGLKPEESPEEQNTTGQTDPKKQKNRLRFTEAG